MKSLKDNYLEAAIGFCLALSITCYILLINIANTDNWQQLVTIKLLFELLGLAILFVLGAKSVFSTTTFKVTSFIGFALTGIICLIFISTDILDLKNGMKTYRGTCIIQESTRGPDDLIIRDTKGIDRRVIFFSHNYDYLIGDAMTAGEYMCSSQVKIIYLEKNRILIKLEIVN